MLACCITPNFEDQVILFGVFCPLDQLISPHLSDSCLPMVFYQSFFSLTFVILLYSVRQYQAVIIESGTNSPRQIFVIGHCDFYLMIAPLIIPSHPVEAAALVVIRVASCFQLTRICSDSSLSATSDPLVLGFTDSSFS